MRVTLHYFGQLRQVAGKPTQALEIDAPVDLPGLLAQAAQGHDPLFARILFAGPGGVDPSVMVLHNNELVTREAMPALRDGDQVSLIPAIAGG